MIWITVALVAFLASIISGVAGFGGGMIFLPVLVATHGTRSSVPILTVAVLLGNLSRVYFYRRHLDFKVISFFVSAALPAAVVGSMVYVSLPAFWIKKGIGLFLILNVLHQYFRRPIRISNAAFFAPLGAVSGFLSALIGGIGPFTAPFFLYYGLVKESFVGTEALCAAAIHLAKSLAYRRLAVLGDAELGAGLAYGAAMVAGSYAAKHILQSMPREKFLILVEVLLVAIGMAMLWTGDQN